VARWKEVLNTDSQHYGGGNLGNDAAALEVQPVAAHGRAQSLTLTLPPLATVFLAPAA
jgi:1,4-alpha-glucan branching enzyme